MGSVAPFGSFSMCFLTISKQSIFEKSVSQPACLALWEILPEKRGSPFLQMNLSHSIIYISVAESIPVLLP